MITLAGFGVGAVVAALIGALYAAIGWVLRHGDTYGDDQ